MLKSTKWITLNIAITECDKTNENRSSEIFGSRSFLCSSSMKIEQSHLIHKRYPSIADKTSGGQVIIRKFDNEWPKQRKKEVVGDLDRVVSKYNMSKTRCYKKLFNKSNKNVLILKKCLDGFIL